MNNLTTYTCKRYSRNSQMNLREAKCYLQVLDDSADFENLNAEPTRRDINFEK